MQTDYQAAITRATPGYLVFLLDMSASMADPFQEGVRRADFLADAVNRTLTEVSTACRKQDGVRHYFDISVLAYSGNQAAAGLSGPHAGHAVIPVTTLAAAPLRVEQRNRKVPDGAGGLVDVPIAFPVWFEPNPDGGTPMCSALRHAARLVGAWCAAHPQSFPPIVMHITDGEASDGEPADVVATSRQITGHKTRDGHALLLNLHIGSGGIAIRYPAEEAALSSHPYASALFQASSALPPPLLARAFRQRLAVQPGSRGYVYNGGMEDVIAFLDMGTKTATELTTVAGGER